MKYLKTFEETSYRGPKIPFTSKRLPNLTDIKQILMGFSGKQILNFIPTGTDSKTEENLISKKREILDKLELPENWLNKQVTKRDISSYYYSEGYYDDPELRGEIDYIIDYIISDSGRSARLNIKRG